MKNMIKILVLAVAMITFNVSTYAQKSERQRMTREQLAFNLRYYDDLGYDEIAGIIGSTADGVKSSYHIAKDKIIKYMNSNN